MHFVGLLTFRVMQELTMMELINFSDEDLHKFTKGFSEKRLLGKPGAFGQVYKGRNKGNNYANCPRKVAIKISKRKDEYVRIMWKQEINALSSISHANVINLVGFADTEEYYALVYERAKQDLEGFRASNKGELDAILLGVASGLEAIHSAGFVHWDIQLRNILLMKDNTVKIADFGLATRKGEKMSFFKDRRFGIFNANDKESAQEKIGVFCFGNLIRELVLLERKEWSPTKCPRILLADTCIVNNPDDRPSMATLVSKLKKIQEEESAKV
ncbi:Os11g0485700 [Oryza sativa Japonica Group]|uniref:Os11g0485700 protein n=2 Tax=Oryza sativa subsp. japonica TaxID=39947 RepID=A0A0P0Y2U7_ORYSJ|nr:Os11g0485700 [Oryza sativa Japonica Group]